MPPEPEAAADEHAGRAGNPPGWNAASDGSAIPLPDKELLREALTHASGAEHRLASNERLEFLGDAILGAVVCELLFLRYPEYLEGDLTKVKSAVVSRQSCAKISEALGLQEFLIVGKGVSTSQSIPPSLLADVFESLIAAIHLDGGSRRPAVHRGRDGTGNRAGRHRRTGRELQVAAAAVGPAGIRHHAAPTSCWTKRARTIASASRVAAQVGGVRYQAAWGRNKKEAEQRAACNALAEINGEPADLPVRLSAAGFFQIEPTDGKAGPRMKASGLVLSTGPFLRSFAATIATPRPTGAS